MEQFPIPAALVEYILLGPADDRRVLQDSPVLGDVWLAYAAEPAGVKDLLITPHKNATAASVADRIYQALRNVPREPTRPRGPRTAYLQGIIAAQLYFHEVLRVLVPMTQWFQLKKTQIEHLIGREDTRRRIGRILDPHRFVASLGPGLAEAETDRADVTALERYIALAGLILWSSGLRPPAGGLKPVDSHEVLARCQPHINEIIEGMLQLYQELIPKVATGAPPDETDEDSGLIFQISLNRPTSPAMDRSVPAVKGDAARTLFNVNCEKIVWAVLDSGIEHTHDAFMVQKGEKPAISRVRKTFDFTNIRTILSSDNADLEEPELEQLLDSILAHNRMGRAEARKRLMAIATDAQAQRPTNWDVVEELITLSAPPDPPSPHGTHVAGIIGADGKQSGNPSGMCPDIRLYDFRVLGRTPEDTEFAVIAALQYIRYLNDRQSYITIHGANLSLSIPHNVRNYACGRTPVCIECERLVDNGVVVVAAAGNRGHQKFETKEGIFESYAAFSITDPGNGEGVITVGATHGNWPHTYGISFFSSRGPTGDGRLKPDLVAPGERIQSTVLNRDWGPESGTSMAAPHVSGAAAMLLARYPELVGQPRRVKRILCETATDLGRERSFQGHGMLDVLRAFQSI